jgi:urease accessory protein UreF
MREMADHIGAWATLVLVANFGGQQIHVPRDPALSPFRELLDEATCTRIAWVYGGAGNRLDLPVGRAAVNAARRAVVIAAVRAKKISGADAQKIIGTSRTYVAHLVNHTDEGKAAATRRLAQALPAQPDLFSKLPE